MNDSSRTRRPSNGLRFAIGVMALSVAPAALAIGPTLPLRFDDAAAPEAWTVGVVVDPEQIGTVRIRREVYAEGRQVRTEPVATREEGVSIGGRTVSGMRLPLNFQGMQDFTRMPAFAQKIVLEGRWLQQPSTQPLRVQRWFYFTVRDGEIAPIGREEYARLTDPVERAVDSRGQAVVGQRGAQIATEVSLPQTRGAFDRQVRPNGPAAQEGAGEGRAAPRDVSEANER